MGCCITKEKKKTNPPVKQSKPKSLISKNALVHLVKGNISDRYKIIKKIGDGGFGVVKLGIHKETNSKRAIKSMNLSQHLDVEKMMEEVNILKNLDHPNIIKVFEVIQDSRCLNIVMEFCSGGELFDKIKATNGFSENIAAKYMLDVVSAVRYCHEANLVHRDLKPENILFETPEPGARLKIIDFGTSQYFKPKEKMRRFIGTTYYIAPEVIDKNYDQKCDVWSLGIILYIMLCGVPPFYSKNEEEIYEKIKKMPVSFKGEAWTTVSDEAKILIQKMLRKDPASRYSINDVYLDPWIQNRAHNRVPDQPIAKVAMKNLKNFKAENNLQKITLNYIMTQLVSNEEIEDLRNIFQEIDKNGDGKLSKEEIEQGYSNFGREIDLDIVEIMERCDTDGNGYLDYTEFLTAAVNWQKLLSNDRLATAFKVYDKNGDGKISLNELAETLSNSGVDQVTLTDMIRLADKNGDGEIDFEEFKELMKIKPEIPNRV